MSLNYIDLYLLNFRNNIKFLKKTKDLKWSDITKIIYVNKLNLKMTYMKKFSYGQIQSLDLEKAMLIANVLGHDWYEMLVWDLSKTLDVENSNQWLED
tara:strand:- start:174 stop:467 length:294 start_codon:yes stop_codon:yes gene_type:complete